MSGISARRKTREADARRGIETGESVFGLHEKRGRDYRLRRAEGWSRPISSRPDEGGIGLFNNVRQVVKARWVDPLGWKDYVDLRWQDRISVMPTTKIPLMEGS